jgi:hypothetical protein
MNGEELPYEQLLERETAQIPRSCSQGLHPELDSSALCDEDDTAKFQSLIGVLQWTILLCCFDIAVVAMTLGCYRAAQRKGAFRGS